jgi:hypothetical protein
MKVKLSFLRHNASIDRFTERIIACCCCVVDWKSFKREKKDIELFEWFCWLDFDKNNMGGFSKDSFMVGKRIIKVEISELFIVNPFRTISLSNFPLIWLDLKWKFDEI